MLVIYLYAHTNMQTLQNVSPDVANWIIPDDIHFLWSVPSYRINGYLGPMSFIENEVGRKQDNIVLKWRSIWGMFVVHFQLDNAFNSFTHTFIETEWVTAWGICKRAQKLLYQFPIICHSCHYITPCSILPTVF